MPAANGGALVQGVPICFQANERNVLAERVGFEPTLEFPLNTLSKRAPSATRPSLRFTGRIRLRELFHCNVCRLSSCAGVLTAPVDYLGCAANHCLRYPRR